MDIVIIGGHGKVALLLAPLLVNQGHSVTSLIRNPDHASEVELTGARALVFDVEHQDTQALVEVLRGADAVVWSAGAGGGNPERTYAVDRDAAIRSMNAAEQAGVARYVMVSYFGAGRVNRVEQDDPFYAYQAAKETADAHLAGTSLAWTIVGPGGLTADPSPHGVTPVGESATRTATSRALVAEVVAEVLTDPRAERQTLDFSDGATPIVDWIASVADGRVPGAAGA